MNLGGRGQIIGKMVFEFVFREAGNSRQTTLVSKVTDIIQCGTSMPFFKTGDARQKEESNGTVATLENREKTR